MIILQSLIFYFDKSGILKSITTSYNLYIMGIIKKLPLHEAHKIAAGEVVERPASALKELVENSLDAGASAITIYCTDSGQTLLRVIDNGKGMAADDAQACFEHHATSKISTVEDLHTISSFGFRGEALTSIAAISKVTLTTRQHDIALGVQVCHENGSIVAVDEVACPVGTDIRVHDLFYNVPARKKFLKTAQTEWRHIVQLFQAFCFAYPTIHFKLYNHESLVHNCPGVKTVAERAHQLWEPTVANGMIELQQSDHETVQCTGIISHHQTYRYDRSSIFLFVNNRWVKNPHMVKAIMKGYLNILPPERFPAAVLMITVPTESVDINIHPRKEEVQFTQPRTVDNVVKNSITKTLEAHHAQRFSSVKSIYSSKTPVMQAEAPPFSTTPSFSHAPVLAQPFVPSVAPYIGEFPAPLGTRTVFSPQKNALKDVVPQPTIFQETLVEEASFTIVGTLYNTYIIVQTETETIFVDQHAAHERILYEQFKKNFGTLSTIELLFPHVITLSAHEQALFPVLKKIVAAHGVQLEQLGPDRCVVQAVPVHLKNSPLSELIKEIVATLDENQLNDNQELSKTLHEKVHAMMACKAAVKAGDILTQEQQLKLIRDLYITSNKIACPHGRPTLWSLPLYELEKKFKRKL